jgi:parallel beta-helix repeat protein
MQGEKWMMSMTRQLVFLTALIIVLVGTLGLAFNVQRAEASRTVYIKTTGEVEGTDKIQRDGNIYTFTDHINDSIVVERSNITVDGNGYTLQGNGTGYGFSLYNTNNVTIKNTNIKSFYYGVYFNSTSQNVITENNVTNNEYGVWLDYSLNSCISGNNIATSNWNGVWLHYSSNSSVTGNNITDNWRGVWLGYSSNSSVTGNNITDNKDYGVKLSYSSHNNISENTFVNDGLSIQYSIENVVDDNLVNSKPLIYLEGISDYTVENAGQVVLICCSGILVENLDLSNASVGVELWRTNNTKISGNNMTANNLYGIGFYHSSNNSITGNNITANNDYGIGFYYSPNNSIAGNNIMANNDFGIWLGYSSNNNSVSGNSIAGNDWDGIAFYYSSNNNSVSGNSITDNGCGVGLYSNNNNVSRNSIRDNDFGIRLYLSFNNSIYQNNFVNNRNQIHTYNSVNSWNDGYPSGGNYWSGYNGTDLFGGPDQNKTGSDGIGDAAYIIDADNTDNYPLMGTFSSFNTSLSYHVDVISNSTTEGFQYFECNRTIRMHVSGEPNYGFCRVCIPHELMNVTGISVVIDDGVTPVLHPNYNVYDNGTHRWIYFSYEHSTHKIDIIQEFPSFLILSLFMVITLLAVIAYKRKQTMKKEKETRHHTQRARLLVQARYGSLKNLHIILMKRL